MAIVEIPRSAVTLTGSSTLSGSYPVSGAWDGTLTSPGQSWLSAAGSPQWLRFSLNAGYAVTRFDIKPYAGLNDGNFKTWQLQGSNDGTTWTSLGSYTATSWNGSVQTFSVATPTSYTNYRYYVTAPFTSSSGATGLAETRLYYDDSAGVTQAPTDPNAALAVSQIQVMQGATDYANNGQVGLVATNLLDADATTDYSPSPTGTFDVILTLGTAATVDKYNWTSSYRYAASYAPTGWTLQGSTDGTTWTTITTVTGQTWATSQTQTYTVPAPSGPWLKYRFQGMTPQGGTATPWWMGGVQLFATGGAAASSGVGFGLFI